jgi:hypothetical protein
MSINKPSAEEAMELQGCLTVAMHEKAKQRMGRLSFVIILASLIISLIWGIFWPFIIGLVMSFLISYYIWSSCFRYLEHKTGMPRSVQMYFRSRYKQDEVFAAKVNAIFPQLRSGRR